LDRNAAGLFEGALLPGVRNVVTESKTLSEPVISERVSAIENEIPAYRAISKLAIGSMICGLLAALSFVDSLFLIAGGIAAVLGILAQRNIKRYPDILTGKTLAQAGIALGLAFSLSSVTIGFMHNFILKNEAKKFALQYTKTLASNNVADALWYRVPPLARKGLTPRQLLEQYTKGSPDKRAAEEYMGTLRQLVERAGLPGAKLEFVEVERIGFDRMTPFAILLYKVEGGTAPPDKDHDHAEGKDHKDHHEPLKTEYAGIEIKSGEDGGYNWYVSEALFPYKPKSHEVRQAPVDDGHGH
jgi:hypothetical protein